MRKKYDALFGFPMPLMMVLHQNVHFYVEFLPLQRTATKLKYLAAVESFDGDVFGRRDSGRGGGSVEGFIIARLPSSCARWFDLSGAT